jgi:hypothetical protein
MKVKSAREWRLMIKFMCWFLGSLGRNPHYPLKKKLHFFESRDIHGGKQKLLPPPKLKFQSVSL